jgi:hypothetical protein
MPLLSDSHASTRCRSRATWNATRIPQTAQADKRNEAPPCPDESEIARIQRVGHHGCRFGALGRDKPATLGEGEEGPEGGTTGAARSQPSRQAPCPPDMSSRRVATAKRQATSANRPFMVSLASVGAHRPLRSVDIAQQIVMRAVSAIIGPTAQ